MWRRNLGLSHPKLTEILHSNFAGCSPLADALTGHDAAVYCLGTYTGTVPDEELRRITVDYTVEFARALRASSSNPTFAFLSGSDADAPLPRWPCSRGARLMPRQLLRKNALKLRRRNLCFA